MEQIINLGKIPAKYRFTYKRSLQLLLADTDLPDTICEEDLPDTKQNVLEQHTAIVEEIEKEMDLPNKIENFKLEDWRFTIDEDFNFWAMSKEYVDKHYK
jgi:hypothetical protein